ncbi:response regulator transcription factor [Arthrobacter caoxuetaonis]|uniref:Response regulator transcription factor n=1 Tax=Arthrobacter caoxuetaonis TaxID=2886935 RepID=A0A9X1MF56_9MICC|nr:response regulator transcription factor [Arthrobacter caoxuetaonis]MCC3283546.1 response regulator transcription factor [Arthrobacter caoxuetaonis]MCC3298944.1 response regulator transcription factor [Arthrobacter caoxuetaonis]USQ58711.1 response regulator transcription factor [Arthrobacter caoxuetaonis]
MEDQPRILVVEDDRALSRMLVEILESVGYAVTTAFDGQRALHLGLTQEFDVLLLDRGLPAIEGLDVLARLRSRGVGVPALVLSALGNPSDRVEGLDRGAEDYLAKPFDVDELLARLRVLRRRTIREVPVLPVPGGMFDAAGRTVTTGAGAVVVLSEREAALLEELARRPGQVFPREDLHALVFPDADDDGVVDTYVHYLRRKLGRNAVLTVRGIGYRLGRQE